MKMSAWMDFFLDGLNYSEYELVILFIYLLGLVASLFMYLFF